MRRAAALWTVVMMASVVFLVACGADGGGSSVDAGPADAAAPDGSVDAPEGSCDPACGPYEFCEVGLCVPAPCDLECGGHGTCLGNQCVCDPGWGKSLCHGCIDGYYGPECTACGCVYGTCDDGEDRDGSCACDDGWIGPACDEEAPVGAPFGEGPYGNAILDMVADFEVATLDGTWKFSDEWTGLDSYVFIFKWGQSEYNSEVWATSVKALLKRSPPGVHYFFGSYDTTFHEDMVAMRARVEEATSSMAAQDRAHWLAHTHFIDNQGFNVGGGLGQFVNAYGFFWFAIDRAQRWRLVGSLYDWPTGQYPMKFLANEPYAFDYEAEIDEAMASMAAMGATEVVVMDDVVHGGGWGGGNTSWVDATFPDKDAMAQFDSMAVHFWMRCPDHQQGKDNGCPEWDRSELLFVCDQVVAGGSPEPEPPVSCQPEVPEVPETPGTCGGDEVAPCTTDTDCSEGVTCEGFLSGTEGIPADTIGCQCRRPDGEVVDVDRPCNAEGTGYQDCPCGCGTEIARWITTYGREGRWLTDLTPYLPLLSEGGDQRFRFVGANGQPLDMTFYLYDSGAAERPTAMQYLWGRPWGTPFDETYNDGKHPDVVFSVPDGVDRVEIAALITGHGNGTTAEGCAEFCPFQSEFVINGVTHFKENPLAGTAYGCYDQAAGGVVPNQFGSWPFGRAGWCPGLDVKIWRQDITADLVDGDNTLTHRGLYAGGDYTPTVTASGYMPEILMSSWLVFYEDKD